jgi:predicted DNA-binding antitoxin AbrB/MazE fold protein
MSFQFEAVYESGVFRPLESVQLPEHQHVTVTIDKVLTTRASDVQAHFTLPPDRWQAFCDALDAPPKALPRLKKLLSEPSVFDGNGTTAS